MSFIQVEQHVELKALNGRLEDIITLMSRVACALEKLAPPLTQAEPFKADLQDLIETTYFQERREELDQLAGEMGAFPDSDQFYRMIEEYEKQVVEVYGEKALDELPWNKTERGRIFWRGHKKGSPEKSTGNAEPPRTGQNGTYPPDTE